MNNLHPAIEASLNGLFPCGASSAERQYQSRLKDFDYEAAVEAEYEYLVWQDKYTQYNTDSMLDALSEANDQRLSSLCDMLKNKNYEQAGREVARLIDAHLEILARNAAKHLVNIGL